MVIGQRVAVEAAWASTAATRWEGKGVRLCDLDSAAGLGAVGMVTALDLGAGALGLAAAEAVGTNSGTISISRVGLTIDSR
jgi:hypothetical protein